jgi:TctA family transporter
MEMKKKLIFKCILAWAITLCRVVIGLVVIKTGFDFSRGGGTFSFQQTDTVTGIFVIIIGVYFVFSSISSRLVDQSE